jgi:hypothetical protein
MDAPLELAAELAERTGEGTAYWLGFLTEAPLSNC